VDPSVIRPAIFPVVPEKAVNGSAISNAIPIALHKGRENVIFFTSAGNCTLLQPECFLCKLDFLSGETRQKAPSCTFLLLSGGQTTRRVLKNWTNIKQNQNVRAPSSRVCE
jgi:hypothetical protein